MAVKDYTEAEFKTFIKSSFDELRFLPSGVAIEDSDLTNAFEWATAQLGYDIPASNDEQKANKYEWLANRMESYLYKLLCQSYATSTDVDKHKTRQIFEGFVRAKGLLDKTFREDFIDPVSGPTARTSGFVSNEFGEDISYRELEPIDRETGEIDGIDN